jgi:hypothetical protein
MRNKVILFAFCLLASVGLAGIFSGFRGLILVKVGLEGGQIVIDSRSDTALPKVLPENH